MAIVAGDLKFIASERMIDNLSTVAGVGGGGHMSQTEVVDGTENNVFPDVMPGDRVAGVVQLRQVYPIVLSGDNDVLSNAASGLTVRPTDANVEVVAFTATGTSSAAAAAAVGTKWQVPYVDSTYGDASNATGGDSTIGYAGPETIVVGDLVSIRRPAYQWWNGASYQQIAAGEYGVRIVTAVSGATLTVDGSASGWDIYDGKLVVVRLTSLAALGGGTRVSAVSHTTAGASASDDEITIDKLWAAVQLPGASTINESGEPSARLGMLPLYLPGDVLLIENGSTRESVVVEHVNYATGVVTLTAGLVNAFASGSKVTRPVPLGVLQAAANNVFAQQTWTRVWSNAAIGAGISARYSGAITMSNKGGATDRWACVFTSSTQFNLSSERLGQIATGNVGTDFLPLNPMTSEPYFTLLATGWGSGWLPGNVLRFNTRAASAPIWLSRLVKPSAAAGTVQATLFLRGDVDA